MSNRPLSRIQERLFENLQKPMLRRQSRNLTEKSNRNNFSNKNTEGSWVWALLYSLLTLAILIFVFTFLYHWFVQREIISEPPAIPQVIPEQPIPRERAPKGILDMPTQMGAPVSTEGPPDSTENPYLNMYGVPGEPGWQRGIATSGFAADNVGSFYASYPNMYGSQNENPYNPNRYSRRNPFTSDYYLNAEMNNVPRAQLNSYIEDENSYIRDINRRVKEINRYRMFSRKYLRNKAELSELRNFERRLANKVHRESRYQPDLPDQNPSYF